jgi:hypothetical protein
MLTSGTSAMACIVDVLLSVLLVRGRPGGGCGSEWNLEGVVVGGSSTLLGPEGSSDRSPRRAIIPANCRWLFFFGRAGVGQRGPGGGTARYLRTTQWTRASL